MNSPRPIAAIGVPKHSLLAELHAIRGGHADCFATTVGGSVSLVRFIYAFYTTPLFKAERLVLALMPSARSTDAEALALAEARRETFAAWTLWRRRADQIVMIDMRQRTASFFMVEPDPETSRTRLYFGSAVMPPPDSAATTPLGPLFHAAMPLHLIYSRALLWSARRLLDQASGGMTPLRSMKQP